MPNLQRFIPEFREKVLAHVKSSVSKDRWEAFRQISQDTSRQDSDATPLPAHITPEDLLQKATSEDRGLSIDEVLKAYEASPRIEVGSIAAAPILHLPDEGIYMWSRNHQDKEMLSLWLTYPSYPHNW